MRICADETAAVIIDMQERLFGAVSDRTGIAERTVLLLKGLRILEIPIVVTQQYTKGLGPTIEPVRAALGAFSSIEKSSFSCCDEPLFIDGLSSLNRNQIIVAGMEAHVCVMQTVTDLAARGYSPVVIRNCITSRSPADMEAAVERMKQEGALIASYESVLFELCRYAGTDTFRKISALVK